MVGSELGIAAGAYVDGAESADEGVCDVLFSWSGLPMLIKITITIIPMPPTHFAPELPTRITFLFFIGWYKIQSGT